MGLEIRGWPTRRDRRRHGSPQLVPSCRHQLGQVPLRLLLSSARGKAKQGKASQTGDWETESGFSGRRRRVLYMSSRMPLLQRTQMAPSCDKCQNVYTWNELCVGPGLVVSHTTHPLHADRRFYPSDVAA